MNLHWKQRDTDTVKHTRDFGQEQEAFIAVLNMCNRFFLIFKGPVHVRDVMQTGGSESACVCLGLISAFLKHMVDPNVC